MRRDPHATLATALAEVHNFAELVAALHAIKYTGVVSLHLFNGHVQEAECGRPHVVTFPKLGPAQHTSAAVSTKPLDTAEPLTPSSMP